MTQAEFGGEILVKSRIVDYLSSGLYSGPSDCLKELINNSFDADASEVNVFVKPEAEQIVIEDDGHGMSRADFERDFKYIAESHKRDDSDVTKLGRPKIGRIGIGFIAANEVCDVMQILSTKQGSKELLDVSIFFEKMREDLAQRERGTDIAKADFRGTSEELAGSSEHYTRVFLRKIRGAAQGVFAKKGRSPQSSGDSTLYGLRSETVRDLLGKEDLNSWSSFDDYSQTQLKIGLNTPVRYHEQWMPTDLHSDVEDFERDVRNLGFTVRYDGTELRKPILFDPRGRRAFVSRFEFDGGHVSARGYFYAQGQGINPRELRGVLIRIRNSAVGTYDSSFLGFHPGRSSLLQTWISGELMISDGLEAAMNIDRRTLQDTHPAYIELQEAVHDHLARLLARARKELYGAGSADRKKKEAKEIEKRISSVATRALSARAPATARTVKQTWQRSSETSAGRKKLLRRFSVDELYEIVLEVAQDVLPKSILDRFVKRLTKRLNK